MTESVTFLSPPPWPPVWGRWVRACAFAEVLGMAAASSAAVISQATVGSATGPGPFRTRRETNRREVLARITKAGRRLCDRMGPVHATSVRQHFLDHVPRRDLPAIADAFQHLYSAQREAQQ